MKDKLERKELEIFLNIEKECDLYNSFDCFNNSLNEDVYEYINKKVEAINIVDKVKLFICSKDKINLDNFICVYNEYLDNRLKILLKEKRFNFTKQIWLFCMGILFILISLFLNNKVNVIFLEVISTIGSFSIWESANSWLIERKIIIAKIIRIKRLKNMTIGIKKIFRGELDE